MSAADKSPPRFVLSLMKQLNIYTYEEKVVSQTNYIYIIIEHYSIVKLKIEYYAIFFT